MAERPRPPVTESLLQELLLALLGFFGDVFVNAGRSGGVHSIDGKAAPQRHDVADPSRCRVRLATYIDWVDAPNRIVLDDIVQLGWHFSAIESWAAAVQQAAASDPAGGSPYCVALAAGFTELLDVYRQDILAVQARCAAAATPPPLAGLRHQLAPWQALLPPLHRMLFDHARAVAAVPAGAAGGGGSGSGVPEGVRLAAAVRAAAAGCGAPQLASVLQRLAWHADQTLFRQLSAWMVSGRLLDASGEFFIQSMPGFSSGLDFSGNAHADGAAQDAARAAEWHHGFQVRPEALPSHIPLPVAQAVLFVGKAARVLQGAQSGSASWRPDVEGFEVAQRLQRLASLPCFDPLAFQAAIDASRKQAAGALWRLLVGSAKLADHLAALRKYFLLGAGDFWHAFLLQAAPLLAQPPRAATADVDLAATAEAAALASAAADDAILRRHVRIVLRDDPKQEPATSSAAAASTSPSKAASPSGRLLTLTQLDVPGPSYTGSSACDERGSRAAEPDAMRGSGGGGGGGGGGGSGSMVSEGRSPVAGRLYVAALDAWDGLTVEYAPPWPLHLLLTPEVLAKYGALCRLLVRLRRVGAALDGAWAAMRAGGRPGLAARLGSRAGSRGGGDSPAATVGGGNAVLSPGLLRQMAAGAAARRPLWQLRAQMAHFVAHFTSYLQVDVIEVGFNRLQVTVSAAGDYEHAAAAHSEFVDGVLAAAFLDVRNLQATLMALFSLCRRLCARLQESAAGDSLDEALADAQLQRDCQQRLAALVAVLRADHMQARAQAPHLQQLLAALDFNGYFADVAEESNRGYQSS